VGFTRKHHGDTSSFLLNCFFNRQDQARRRAPNSLIINEDSRSAVVEFMNNHHSLSALRKVQRESSVYRDALTIERAPAEAELQTVLLAAGEALVFPVDRLYLKLPAEIRLAIVRGYLFVPVEGP
jgi:hypothetical protein